MQKIAPLSALSFLFLLAGTAQAQPAADSGAPTVEAAADAPSYSFGARVGGYGFRDTSQPAGGSWNDCRMNGVGLFGQRTFGRHLFAEAAFDMYFARDPSTSPTMPPDMDRLSGITTVAGGARIPWRWLSPYVQLGLGLEVTRVKMASAGLEQHEVLPMGFIGVGADLRLTHHLSLGGNIRTNLMKHFDHGGGTAVQSTGTGQMTGEYEAAAQGQLFAKYRM